MSNIFLYAPKYTHCFTKIADTLEKELAPWELSVLECGNFSGACKNHNLRNRDILLIYAADGDNLKTLSGHSGDFQDYNLILILNQNIRDPYRDALRLGPKYINLGEPNISELTDIIDKISEKIHFAI